MKGYSMYKNTNDFYNIFNIKPIRESEPVFGNIPSGFITPTMPIMTNIITRQRYEEVTVEYPEITDEMYLKLICLLTKYYGIALLGETLDELKENILQTCMDNQYTEGFKSEVQKIFEEK